MLEEEKVLLNRYKGLCMTNEEYLKAEAAGMIPRFLATTVAGPAKIRQKSQGIFTDDKFVGLLLDYQQALYLEEAVSNNDPFEAHTCMNLFADMLTISYVPEYRPEKRSYAYVSPTIRPVAIPLSRVRNVTLETGIAPDTKLHYYLHIVFDNEMDYLADLFTVAGDQITADANWAAEVNAVLFSRETSINIYQPDKARAIADHILQIIQDHIKSSMNFDIRHQILESLFEEAVWPEMKESVYTTEAYFLDVMIEHLDYLTFTEVGKDIAFQLKPMIKQEQECDQAITDLKEQFAKKRRRLWGASVIKQRSMRKELNQMLEDTKQKEKEKVQCHQNIRDKLQEILCRDMTIKSE